ncbi:MAG: glycosyl hydrolase [Verrucomicrobia bacterium]|nr:glycosyl hydrolase [Verrucomicrobiota bacterium]
MHPSPLNNPSRRTFLVQSAAALGLPLAAPQILAKPVAGANDKLNLACAAIQPASVGEADMVGLEGQFRDLPMAARRNTGPLFWMHGTESKEDLEKELNHVADGGNGSFIAESRPHNDWLGEGWYRDLGICLTAAKKHDLQLWIFDDYWFPSQMMGGRVPAQYGTKVLNAAAITVTGPMRHEAEGCLGETFITVLAGKETADGSVDGTSLVDLGTSIRNGKLAWDVPAGQWKVMTFTWAFKEVTGADWKKIMVDGASSDCVEWFIKTVYQPHYDRFKDDFGKTIVGFFYDEPYTQGDWGSDLPKWMAEHNIDIKKVLVAYKFKLAGEEQVAGRYQFLNTFAESWGRTMYGGMSRWCREHQVISQGHFMEHNCFDRGQNAGNVMQLMKYSDRGGIDLVIHGLYPGQRPLGMYQTPKIASSVSHIYGKEGNDDVAFSEVYGGYDQKLTYPNMKWLADWHQVRGVNFLIPHSFNPKAPFDDDFPPYFNNGGFEPRWPLYRVWADYTSRLSLMLTGGRHVCPVALVHVGQSYHVGKTIRPEDMTSALQDALYDCDWLPYDAWEDLSRIDGRLIRLRNEDYRVLVLPATEVIPWKTLAKAKEFLDAGGVVMGYGILPTLSATLGKTSADITALRSAIWGDNPMSGTTACRITPAGGRSYFLPEKPTSAQIQAALAGDASIHATLEVTKGHTDDWLHVLHRWKAGRDVFLVCNQDHREGAKEFRLRITAPGEPECWDPMRNEITALPCQRDGEVAEIDLTLQPSESVLLVFQATKRALPLRGAVTVATREIPVCDARPATDKTPPAKWVVVKATYGIPGDAQRSRDVRERLQKIIDAGERSLQVGNLAEGDDPANGVVKTLVAECTVGDKRITLEGQDPQIVALSDRQPTLSQELNRIAAGRPVTSSPVEADPYSGVATIPADINLATSRIYIELDGISPEESAAISINGKPAGGFICRPFRLDVTRFLKPGDNRVEVVPFAPKTVKLSVYPR